MGVASIHECRRLQVVKGPLPEKSNEAEQSSACQHCMLCPEELAITHPGHVTRHLSIYAALMLIESRLVQRQRRLSERDFGSRSRRETR
jgi:hypothetical protein